MIIARNRERRIHNDKATHSPKQTKKDCASLSVAYAVNEEIKEKQNAYQGENTDNKHIIQNC